MKIPSAAVLGCGCPLQIRLTTDAPLSAVRRFAATCTPPVPIHGSHVIYLPNHLRLPVLSQLAQSDLVRRIQIECEIEDQLH